MQARLTQLQSLIGLDQQAFVQRFGIQPDQVRTAAAYEQLKDVTEIHNPDHPDLGTARCYFRAGKLALIYLPDPVGLGGVAALKAELGGDGVVLRSRAGKTSNLHVYAAKGIAMSAGDDIEFIEIFAPTTEKDYEQSIYEPIGPYKL